MSNDAVYQIIKEFLKINLNNISEFYIFTEKYCPAPFKCCGKIKGTAILNRETFLKLENKI
jgi:hypothetical protein